MMILTRQNSPWAFLSHLMAVPMRIGTALTHASDGRPANSCHSGSGLHYPGERCAKSAECLGCGVVDEFGNSKLIAEVSFTVKNGMQKRGAAAGTLTVGGAFSGAVVIYATAPPGGGSTCYWTSFGIETGDSIHFSDGSAFGPDIYGHGGPLQSIVIECVYDGHSLEEWYASGIDLSFGAVVLEAKPNTSICPTGETFVETSVASSSYVTPGTCSLEVTVPPP